MPKINAYIAQMPQTRTQLRGFSAEIPSMVPRRVLGASIPTGLPTKGTWSVVFHFHLCKGKILLGVSLDLRTQVLLYEAFCRAEQLTGILGGSGPCAGAAG